MRIKIRSCVTTLFVMLLVIIGVVIISTIDLTPSNVSTYKAAVKKYKETGDSRTKVQRAYNRLTWQEKKEVNKK